jgi:hypothetical protein
LVLKENILKGIVCHILGYHYFIALCAVAFALDIAWILDFPPLDAGFYAFIYFATFSAYNVYYVSDNSKPLAKAYSLVGFLGTMVTFFLTQNINLSYLAIIAALSSLYLFPIIFRSQKSNAIRWIRLVILVIVWLLTTTLLPLSNTSFTSNLLPLFVYRFLFLWSISLLFLMRDEAEFFKAGVLNRVLAISLLLQLFAAGFYFSTDEIFSLFFIVMTLLVALVSWLALKKKRSPYFYLGIVDGLMLLEGVLVFLMNLKFVD